MRKWYLILWWNVISQLQVCQIVRTWYPACLFTIQKVWHDFTQFWVSHIYVLLGYKYLKSGLRITISSPRASNWSKFEQKECIWVCQAGTKNLSSKFSWKLSKLGQITKLFTKNRKPVFWGPKNRLFTENRFSEKLKTVQSLWQIYAVFN